LALSPRGRAETEYAWSIEPPVNAVFIGAGFLAGTLATGLVLASSLLLATIIHNDRFRWDYPPTWVARSCRRPRGGRASA
jgi:hypothetical protein